MVEITAYFLFFTASVVCGVIDYKRYIIPNAVTLPLIATGLGLQLYLRNWTVLLVAFLSFFVILVLASATGGMGGGDVKLITAMFLWIRPSDCLNIIIISCIIGIIWGIAKRLNHAGWKEVINSCISRLAIYYSPLRISSLPDSKSEKSVNNTVPFGTCVAMGTSVYTLCMYLI